MSKTKGKGKWQLNNNRIPRKESRNCYICNKQGHLVKDCRQNKNANKREGGPSQNRWRRPQNNIAQRQGESLFMATKNEKYDGEWFLDSGFSRHMTSNKELFIEFNHER